MSRESEILSIPNKAHDLRASGAIVAHRYHRLCAYRFAQYCYKDGTNGANGHSKIDHREECRLRWALQEDLEINNTNEALSQDSFRAGVTAPAFPFLRASGVEYYRETADSRLLCLGGRKNPSSKSLLR